MHSLSDTEFKGCDDMAKDNPEQTAPEGKSDLCCHFLPP